MCNIAYTIDNQFVCKIAYWGVRYIIFNCKERVKYKTYKR